MSISSTSRRAGSAWISAAWPVPNSEATAGGRAGGVCAASGLGYGFSTISGAVEAAIFMIAVTSAAATLFLTSAA